MQVSEHSNHSLPRGVVERLSQTASLSYDAALPSKVRPQDESKFIKKPSLQPISFFDLVGKMDRIWADLQAQVVQLHQVKNAVQWRKPIGLHIFDAVAAIEGSLTDAAKKLHGDDGVDKKIAFITDLRAIPDAIKRVQQLQVQLLLCEKTTARLVALCQTRKIDELHESFQAALPRLFDFHNSAEVALGRGVDAVDSLIKSYVDSVDPHLWDFYSENDALAFLDRLCNVATPTFEKTKSGKDEKVKYRARTKLYVKIFTVCEHLAEMQQQEQLIRWRLEILRGLKDILANNLQNTAVTKPRQLGLGQVELQAPSIGQEDLDRLIANQRDEAYTLELEKLWPWSQKPLDRLLGEDLERDVGRYLGGLLLVLKERITSFCQGVVEPDQLTADALHLKGCLAALERKYTEKMQAIYTLSYRDFVQSLFRYTDGLDWGFKEAKGLLKLLSRCADPSKVQIIRVMQAVDAHLKPPIGTVIEASSLFASANAMRTLKEMVLPADRALDTMFARTRAVLEDVHAQKDPEILKLTPQEQQVPTLVFGGSLVNADEPLSTDVIQYIVKRAQQFLFLPVPSDHDMELELVLNALKKQVPNCYAQSLFDPGFKSIVSAYEKKYLAMRLDKRLLDSATGVASKVVAISGSSRKLLQYTKAWQRFFEFKLLSFGQKGADAMQGVLVEWLFSAGKSNQFSPIHKAVLEKSLDAWEVDDPAVFLQSLPCIDTTKEQAFAGLLLRMLGACLFAKDPNEQVAVQNRLLVLLSKEEYTPLFDGLDANLKWLLTENIQQKILVCSHSVDKTLVLTAKEEAFLLRMEGSLEQFLAADAFRVEDQAVQMVLDTIIRYPGIVSDEAQARIQARYDEKLEKFMQEATGKGYDALAKGNPVAGIFASEIQELYFSGE